MKINGQPEGGQGGGLTPTQEALINQVPNKVNQVRLVTDGSAIRHEGALEPLTFEQIYALVMDNSKYVYIVMDNNIRFRPSAYDGDAIWFDSSFIEEGKPNILRCIINSDNRVDITQIVVASEEYVDEKVAEAGGLTPEQEAALAPLMNTSNGFLYATASLSSRTCIYKKADYFTGTTSGRQTFAVGDDVYYLGKLNSGYFNKIYKFNFDTLEFEEFVNIPEDIKLTYVYPMWKGIDSGVERLYFGGRFEIVDNNITDTGILDGRDYRSNYTHHNVYTFESGNTYLVSFDSASASMYMDGGYFDECEITCPEGLMQQLFQYDCKYNGKQLLIANGVMYELTEVATGSLSVVVVDEPYFPITIDGVNIQGSLFAQIKGKMYYFKNSSNLVYELINGEWTLIDVPGVGTTQKFNTQGAVARDLVFGHGYDTQSTLNIMNLDNSQYGGNTIWKKIDVATKDDITKALGGLESITNEILYK